MMYARTRRFPRHMMWAGFLLVALSLLLVLAQALLPFASNARSLGVSALLPVVDAGSAAADAIGDRYDSAFSSGAIITENEDLRLQLAMLQAEKAELLTRLAEYDQEALLSTQLPSFAPRTLAARVVSPITNAKQRRLWINVGTSQGVINGQAVIGTKGIVGVIRETHDHYSIVQLVTDPESKWGGEAIARGERGMVLGTGEANVLSFKLEKTTTALEAGDEISTSGMKGSVAPAGILLGTVIEVTVDEAGERHALLELPEAIEELRFVYVLNASQLPWEPGK